MLDDSVVLAYDSVSVSFFFLWRIFFFRLNEDDGKENSRKLFFFLIEVTSAWKNYLMT